MLHYIVFLGAAAQLAGIFSYARDTLRGTTKPNRVTWLMWSIAPTIGTVAAIMKGVTWAVLPVFAAGFGPFLVFAASFVNKNSYWKLEKFDYLCGLCSLLALIFWALTQNPNVAIAFAIASDGFAAVPTVIKARKYPETENMWPFVAGMFSVCTAFVAITEWDFASYAFPLYLFIICFLLTVTIWRGQHIKRTA